MPRASQYKILHKHKNKKITPPPSISTSPAPPSDYQLPSNGLLPGACNENDRVRLQQLYDARIKSQRRLPNLAKSIFVRKSSNSLQRNSSGIPDEDGTIKSCAPPGLGSQISSGSDDSHLGIPHPSSTSSIGGGVFTGAQPRRGSFLYRSDSVTDNNEKINRRRSRHGSSTTSSISSQGNQIEELVTPFAQVMSSLHTVRNDLHLLTNIRQNKMRRGSDGLHMNPRVAQIYEVGDGSHIKEDMFKKLATDTLCEFDWCLGQLESLKASMSISEMASNKFKKLLDKELKNKGVVSSEISAWVLQNYVDKDNDDTTAPSKNQNTSNKFIRSQNLIKSLSNLKASVEQLKDSIPRFGIELSNEEPVEKVMVNLNTWNFDVFHLSDVTVNRPLVTTVYTILESRDLFNSLKINKTKCLTYFHSVESHYNKDVPFHNSLHGADVAQTAHILLSAKVFECVFTDLETLAVLFAAAVHDVDHPGMNNQYLINTSAEMALMYNDESVLENHHLAVAFQLLQHQEADMLDMFSKQERQLFRKMVIQMVLSTDNAKHMNSLSTLKTYIETKKLAKSQKPLQLESFSEKMHVLDMLIHCSDLSNPTKALDKYEKWVDRLMEEWWIQGDLERSAGMDISPGMDRYKQNIAKTQVAFIDYVVHPLWETWADLVYPDAQNVLEALVQNREHYAQLVSLQASEQVIVEGDECSDGSKSSTEELAEEPEKET